MMKEKQSLKIKSQHLKSAHRFDRDRIVHEAVVQGVERLEVAKSNVFNIPASGGNPRDRLGVRFFG
ncbi:hypothetical protein [Heliomicrobium undosum]|uniref:hypothetical protein n=1 Tax=Heliomicrobium undosum TaxID=121734 RepID=UPI001F1D7EB8|nr:hypothetical protein [Heliomicrobium undosum]